MGYALFASRKLFYTNMVNNLNLQLDEINQKREQFLKASAAIADGVISPEEIAGATSQDERGYYTSIFLPGINNMLTSDEAKATSDLYMAQIESMFPTVNSKGEAINYTKLQQAQKAAIQTQSQVMLERSLREQFAKDQSKKIALEEHKLDIEQKKIETQLTAAQKELEAIQQAEGRAIQEATPKYAGLG